MSTHYILDGKEVAKADLMTWAKWFQSANRIVAQTSLPSGVWVSTVFLGIDYNWTGRGPPIVFETMAFDKPADGRGMCGDELETRRYSTWAQAEEGHLQIVDDLTDAENVALRLLSKAETSG